MGVRNGRSVEIKRDTIVTVGILELYVVTVFRDSSSFVVKACFRNSVFFFVTVMIIKIFLWIIEVLVHVQF